MFRRPMTVAAVVIIAVLLVATGGCSTDNRSMDGSRWRLNGWTLSSLNPADLEITAQFAGGRISGNSGVNSYSGPVRLGPGAAFATGRLSSTRMAGPEPTMRAEHAYVMLLGEARSFKLAAGKLTLHDGHGNESLVFEAVNQ